MTFSRWCIALLLMLVGIANSIWVLAQPPFVPGWGVGHVSRWTTASEIRVFENVVVCDGSICDIREDASAQCTCGDTGTVTFITTPESDGD